MSSDNASESSARSRTSRNEAKRLKKEKKEKNVEDDKFERMMKAQENHFKSLQTQMGGLSGQIGTVQDSVKELSGELSTFKNETNVKFQKVDDHIDEQKKVISQIQKDMVEIKKEQKEFKEKPDFVEQSGGGKVSGAGSSGGGGGGKDKEWWEIPRNRRKIIIVGGFDYDTPGEDIISTLKEITVNFKDLIVDYQSMGKLASVGKLIFKSSNAMWEMLKALKGSKLKEGLWHGIISTEEERLIAKRTTIGVKAIREIYISKNLVPGGKDIKKVVDGDWNKGLVYVKPDKKVTRVFEKPKGEEAWILGSEADQLELGDLNTILEDINNATL